MRRALVVAASLALSCAGAPPKGEPPSPKVTTTASNGWACPAFVAHEAEWPKESPGTSTTIVPQFVDTSASIGALAWSPDARAIAFVAGMQAGVIGRDGAVRAWLASDVGALEAVRFDRASEILVASGPGGVEVFDVHGVRSPKVLATDLATSRVGVDGTKVFAIDARMGLVAMDALTGATTRTPIDAPKEAPIEISDDASAIAWVDEGAIVVWSRATSKPCAKVAPKHGVVKVAFDARGSLLVRDAATVEGWDAHGNALDEAPIEGSPFEYAAEATSFDRSAVAIGEGEKIVIADASTEARHELASLEPPSGVDQLEVYPPTGVIVGRVAYASAVRVFRASDLSMIAEESTADADDLRIDAAPNGARIGVFTMKMGMPGVAQMVVIDATTGKRLGVARGGPGGQLLDWRADGRELAWKDGDVVRLYATDAMKEQPAFWKKDLQLDTFSWSDGGAAEALVGASWSGESLLEVFVKGKKHASVVLDSNAPIRLAEDGTIFRDAGEAFERYDVIHAAFVPLFGGVASTSVCDLEPSIPAVACASRESLDVIDEKGARRTFATSIESPTKVRWRAERVVVFGGGLLEMLDATSGASIARVPFDGDELRGTGAIVAAMGAHRDVVRLVGGAAPVSVRAPIVDDRVIPVAWSDHALAGEAKAFAFFRARLGDDLLASPIEAASTGAAYVRPRLISETVTPP